MKLPTLYARTSLGQTQEWTIEVKNGAYRTHEGIVGGKITTSEWTQCPGKNIGKKNETTAEEQAVKEAKSKHKKKADSGYHEDVSKIDEAKFFGPMLAHKWDDYGDDVKYPVFVQPKLDGMRCIVQLSGMFSRNGKPVLSAPHIHHALSTILKKNPTLVFDGELYNHDLKDDFDRIMSLAKQGKPTAEDLAASERDLQYWVYDLFDSANPKRPYAERLKLLKELIGNSDCVRVIPNHQKHDRDGVSRMFEAFVSEGYEGAMTRNPQSVYENKRSRELLKVKNFIEEEFELVRFEEGRGNRAGMATRAILKMKDGRTFEAGMIGSHAVCKRLLVEQEALIGKMATVKFFNYTPDGIPRFGKFKAIRDE